MSEEQINELKPETYIKVNVTRNRMEASMQIDVPEGARPVTVEEVMAKIKISGVVFGIDEKAVQKACRHPDFRFDIAKGQQAVNGMDAVIKYHVDRQNNGRPLELENGQVDYKNLNLFTVVHEGQLLAEKIPSTPGIPGTDVLGQTFPPKPGKDIMLPLSKNVRVEDNAIYATIAGQLQVANNKISVIPILEIEGNVDLSTGNIEFIGSVTVRGSVQAGFTVKAEGNVEVFGSVAGGAVEGKSVMVKGGIQGRSHGYVKAKKNVIAKFIENAKVYAGADVMVNDTILHSEVSAGKRVIVEGKRGMIAGGTITAGAEIRAKVVGTYMAIGTNLEVGINPMLRDEYQNIRQEMKKVDTSLDQVQKMLHTLKAMDPNRIPQDKKDMLLKLTKTQFHLVGQSENMRRRMAEIEQGFEEMKFGRIKVANAIFPGGKVVVGNLVKTIRETLQFVSLYAEDGEVRIGSFK